MSFIRSFLEENLSSTVKSVLYFMVFDKLVFAKKFRSSKVTFDNEEITSN